MGKNFLDNFFDKVDEGLSAVEGFRTEPPESEDEEGGGDELHKAWESSWRNPTSWKTCGTPTWHAFSGGKSLCEAGHKDPMPDLHKPLEVGKSIVACTSCISAVSRG